MRGKWARPYTPPANRTYPHNIFLIGMMGAGKTSVGRLLSRRLGKTFFDSDHEIESRTGVKIPIIFELEGEAGFRQREAAMIDELTQRDEVVLATGGGAVLNPRNRETLRARGTVVYLRAVVTDLWNRTRHDKNRPLLQTADPLARLTELYTLRDPLYEQTAHVIVDTGRQSLRALVQKLENRLAEYHAQGLDPADLRSEGAHGA